MLVLIITIINKMIININLNQKNGEKDNYDQVCK